MNRVKHALKISGYVALAFVAFAASFVAGKKKDSGTAVVSSPYTYADAPYAEGGYYTGSGGDGGGDGSGGGCGGSSDAGGGADGSGCGSSGG